MKIKYLISCTFTMQLICAFVFTYAKIRFSHVAAQIWHAKTHFSYHQIRKFMIPCRLVFPMQASLPCSGPSLEQDPEYLPHPSPHSTPILVWLSMRIMNRLQVLVCDVYCISCYKVRLFNDNLGISCMYQQVTLI